MWTKNNMPDQTGKTVIITGANTGIGFETALAFYEKGAHTILACRDIGKAQDAITKIQHHAGTGSLEFLELNLANLTATKQSAIEFMAKHQQLDILINNAGVMIPPASKTDDGFELQFGVNFLSHFALTGSLYPLLKATPLSRVVTVSSMAYLRGTIDFDNLRSEHSYDAMREYAQSKLGNILFSLELQRRISALGDQVVSIAAQPGANKTELARHMNKTEFDAAVERVGGLMDPWQGALPSLYAATSPDAQPANLYGPHEDGYRGYPAVAEIIPSGRDEAVAKKLWELAERETGIHFPA